jgi:uncharacterized protein DUF4911
MVPIRKIKTTAPENTLLVEAWAIPSEIGFLNALTEAYEGMVVVRTIDRKAGHLKFWVPEGQLDLLAAVFDDFVKRGWMTHYQTVDPWWDIVEDAPKGQNPIRDQGGR